ncbi:muconate/chloromuconate family cycloisomerase [Burkholderia vietnamiensis]|uniref:muconate/chloromuconate family cycloisomerase n=1 Tax=Burkholderia vietnamiensis TaxID=60552 RepID=UPI00075F179A|nr:muconate/chloromuconate family cycloisomerase [Burkholderia vietnamiensis]KVE31302.1 muconate cycloisomerase [Burkholderia vietnamiensis]KVE51555.1 muconate cycloisomerase [Burkholderia vietnamiensis]KVE90086.1 muconate cycloisomerase [Burkholderia vietnamiensis]KVG08730.1 muconate cycloisomerase [Burkholderia vietnamiensis]MBR7914847.1 muconate/chloromuconate family cycloisomerase [Burkholderia vietnamiensis]
MIATAATIERIDTLLVDVPTIRPHKLSVATMNCQTLVLVRVRCTDGIEGVGEATTIGGLAYGEESPESIKVNIDTYFAPLLQGMDATRPGAAMARARKLFQGNRFAKCALETALFDAQARRAGVPLSELFGGRTTDAVEVAWTLASGDTQRDIAEAEAMLDARRHRAFKLKIGSNAVDDDVAHVIAIKRALGDRGDVRVDVNQAWSETEAIRAGARLAHAGVSLVEQPIAATNRAGLKRLTQLAHVPIMADEALHGPVDAFALAQERAADVFAVKIAQSGGLLGAASVASIASAAGIDLYGGTMLEGAAGTMASAQLFSTFGSLKWGTELFGPLLLTEEILVEPLRYQDFKLHLPATPGLGITFDWPRIERMRRGAR